MFLQVSEKLHSSQCKKNKNQVNPMKYVTGSGLCFQLTCRKGKQEIKSSDQISALSLALVEAIKWENCTRSGSRFCFQCSFINHFFGKASWPSALSLLLYRSLDLLLIIKLSFSELTFTFFLFICTKETATILSSA